MGALIASVALFSPQPKNDLRFSLTGSSWQTNQEEGDYADYANWSDRGRHGAFGVQYRRIFHHSMLYVRTALKIGLSHMTRTQSGDTDEDEVTFKMNSTQVGFLGALGLDLLWFGFEVGVFIHYDTDPRAYSNAIPSPSCRLRAGPKLIHLRIGLLDIVDPVTNPLEMYGDLWFDFVEGSPWWPLFVGIGSETDRWILSFDVRVLSFDVRAPMNGTVRFGWKWRHFEAIGTFTFLWYREPPWERLDPANEFTFTSSFGWRF